LNLEILKNIDARHLQELFEMFSKIAKKEEYRKGDEILRAGRICRKLYFIEKGALRFYYIDKEGKDITHWFLFENDFVTELESFLFKKESDYFIEALEDSVLYSIEFETYQKLSDTYSGIDKLWNVILTKGVIDLGEKAKDLQFRDAKTRYDNLLKKYPNILQRVALGDIASYLGITQQSLSRIRKQK
jgi:CRP-like cAMP-binding protein